MDEKFVLTQVHMCKIFTRDQMSEIFAKWKLALICEKSIFDQILKCL